MENLRAKDYRRIAAENCAGYKGKLAAMTLLTGVFLDAAIVIGGPVALGCAEVNKMLYEKKEWSFRNYFNGFKRFKDGFVTNLLMTIYLCLWCLLFYIPVIIKSYSYSMTYYLMLDNPELSRNEAITKSRELMKGHKWQLFCLEFSYIGWILLCGLTLGVLTLFVAPKMEQAQYAFYRNLTDQK